jgi:RHS repeat-associated protein
VEEHLMGQTSYYHYDGLGSTQLLTDEGANVTDSYCNTAFGLPVDTGAANPTPNPFQYVGRDGYYLDIEPDNYYVRARTYSPVRGRWLSEDLIGPSAVEANLYRYVANSPPNMADPTGHDCVVANPPAIKYGPATIRASAGGVAVSSSDTNPGVISKTPVTQIVCTKQRSYTATYDCSCRYLSNCFGLFGLSIFQHDFSLTEQLNVGYTLPQGNFMFVVNISVPIPKAAIGPWGANLQLYQLAASDQKDADTKCASANFPKWAAPTPTPPQDCP